MSHHEQLADHDLEHVAAEILNLRDEGRGDLSILRRVSRVEDLEHTLGRLESRRLVERSGERLNLTREVRESLRHVDDQRHAQARVVHRALVAREPAAVIGVVEDDRVVGEAVGGEVGEQPSDLGIDPARLQRFYASAAEGQRFADEMARIVDEVKALGPIPPEIRVALESRPEAPAPAFQPEEVEA